MLTALIVDDEPLMRMGIQKAINWSSYGIGEIQTAPNGRIALQMVEERQPDLLLTDVRMPGLDGLELSRAVKERWPAIKIVIISGYDEFSYAKKSIAIGVTDYLLKPIDSKSLGQTIDKVTQEIVDERGKLREQEQLSHLLQQSVGIARQKVLKELLFGESGEKELKRYEHVVGLNDSICGRNAVALVKINSFKEKSTLFRDGGLLHYAVQNILEELLRTEGTGELVDLRPGSLVLVINQDESDYKKMEEFVVKAQAAVLEYLRVPTTWGFGSIASGLQGLRRSYRDADRALKLRWLYPAKRIFAFTGEEAGKAFSGNDIIQTIMQSLQLGSTKAMLDEMEKLKVRFAKDCMYDPESIEAFYLKLAESLEMLLKERSREIQTDLHERVREVLYLSDTLNEAVISLEALFQESVHTLHQHLPKPYSKVIRDVIEFLHLHYKDDISLADAANRVFLNRSYLSYLFVQETGSNFSDFLAVLRLEKAKELLAGGGMKNYEVAEAVGYKDFRHFGQMFKKHTGMTPGEFRKLAP
ncbi:response regulator [Paenibacillus sp. GCM10023248]|uniref:response regulator n=1 Tax=unclassified Paenibacillus TaxID=185978 RepID=UPI002377E6E4|nr:response regulator [Paenibacillus sp. MAHUQ-63]MDD9269372.1 response regulator [Paenibacillus sp. MAHUQ-63]